MAGATNTDQVADLPFPFEVLVENITKVPGVDMVSAGDSPATFRWLSDRNVYVNLGLTRMEDPKKTRLSINNNSYAVTAEDVKDSAKAIAAYMATATWIMPTPQVAQKTYTETKASDLTPTP